MSFMDNMKNNKNNVVTNYNKIISNDQSSVAGIYGWVCPICGRGVAPGQAYCNCKAPKKAPKYEITCHTNPYFNTNILYTTKSI